VSEHEDAVQVSLGTAVMCLDLLEDVRRRLLAPLLDDGIDYEGRTAHELRDWLGILTGVARSLAEQITFAMEVHDGILDLEDNPRIGQ
jgi:hypothetical protein